MKNSKVSTDRLRHYVDIYAEAVVRSLGTGLVFAAAMVLGAIFILNLPEKKARASDQNLVMVPEYQDQGDNAVPDSKIQYAPANGEKPILRTKAFTDEIVQGAHYGEGTEVVIEPGSDFDAKDEPIVEKVAEPAPTPSPAPRVDERGRDIGRRTAEVR